MLKNQPLLTLKLKKADADKKKWDVNNPPGEKQTVNIDTRSGTWMSVDVSPDGKQLVFDLLGDIYSLPVGGGERKHSRIRSHGKCSRVFRLMANTLRLCRTPVVAIMSGSWMPMAATRARCPKKISAC
jgi:hypothetical protein